MLVTGCMGWQNKSGTISSMKTFNLNNKNFGYLNPFIIAEIGVNHEGSLDAAKRMIELVANSGGHAAKFQTYSADKLATKTTSPAYWDTSKESISSQHQLFQKWSSFTDSDYLELAKTSEDLGVVFLSTPFDLDAVNSLEPLVPAYKIASADITNIPLIRAIAGKRKPVIVSVGAANFGEIDLCLSELIKSGVQDISLLHCVLRYPTPPQIAFLKQITDLQERFGASVSIGYSDHVPPTDGGGLPQLELASALGCVVLEKHFTLDKSKPGNDHYHAMDAIDLKRFTENLGRYRELYGEGEIQLDSQKEAIQNARRRIVAKIDLESGSTLSSDNLIALRANVGIEISDWDKVIGSQLSKSVRENQPISWSDL